MSSTLPETSSLVIRQCQRRDLEELERLMATDRDAHQTPAVQSDATRRFQQMRRWYGLMKGLSLFPNPLQHLLSTYVAEQDGQLRGVIQVSPFNQTRSTWRVDQIAVASPTPGEVGQSSPSSVGTQLLRYCLQTIWEARTWLIEVNVNDNDIIGLCRQSGFQPLAQMTYWAIAPNLLQTLAEREPDLPNLLPVGNVDASLLYQLDTVSMPPHVRQVFDRHISDFKTGVLHSAFQGVNRWLNQTETLSGYVFEPQRKAAIGYFKLRLCNSGTQPHEAQITVHPAYTWLYPELFCQMAKVVRAYPEQSLRVISSDYQPEREDYLVQIGAEQTDHTLMLSRSVWHKLREAKPLEGLQLPEVLQSLQPVRKPIPSRFSLIESIRQRPQVQSNPPADLAHPNGPTASPNESSSGAVKPAPSNRSSDSNCPQG